MPLVNYDKVAADLQTELDRFDKVQDEPDLRRVLVIYTGGTFGCKVGKDKKGLDALIPMAGAVFLPVLREKVPLLKDIMPEDPNLVRDYLASLDEKAPEQDKLKHLVDEARPADPRFVYFSFSPTLDSTDATPGMWGDIAEVIEDRKNKYDGFVVIQGTDTLYYTTAALTFMMAGTLKPIIVTGAQTPLIGEVNDAVMNVTGAVRCCIDVPGSTVSSKPRVGDPKQLLGVYLYFNFRLMNGTRCMKIDSHNYGAFTSPNMGYVAHAQPVLIPGERSHVFDMATVKTLHDETLRFFNNRRDHVRLTDKADDGPYYKAKREAAKTPSGNLIDILPVSFNGKYDTWLTRPVAWTQRKIAVVRLAPGIDCPKNLEALEVYLAQCDGVIVEAYGAGNGQNAVKSMLQKLRDEKYIPVAIITECNHSGVSSDYGVAIEPESGALCHDMTLGCAYTRMYLSLHILPHLGNYGGRNTARRDRVEQIMRTPMMMCFTPEDNAFLRNRLVAVGV